MLAGDEAQRALRQRLRLENLTTAAVGVDVRDRTEGLTRPSNGNQSPVAVCVRQIELNEAFAEPEDKVRRAPLAKKRSPPFRTSQGSNALQFRPRVRQEGSTHSTSLLEECEIQKADDARLFIYAWCQGSLVMKLRIEASGFLPQFA